MSMKLLAVAMLFCSIAHGAPNTTAVGTATVRGSMRLDGNQVTGDATLFDGSTVETATSSATLRINYHATIVMATGARSIVHADYVKLEQGVIDWKPTCGFVVEVNGVRITPNSDNAHGVISLSNSSASVSSQSGEFLVLDDHGRLLSRIRPGNSQSFGTGQAQSASPATYFGSLTSVDNHRLLTLFAPDTDVTYELEGRNAEKVRGKFVEVDGMIDPKRSSILAQVDEVITTTKGREMCTEKAIPYPWILGGAAAVAAGTAVGITANRPRVPASR